MKKQKKAVWVGVEQLKNSPAYQETANQEFVELPIVDQLSEERAMESETSRRDFLKYLGFGLGAATLAASCDIPVKKAIPYVVKPDAIVPGIAAYYASSFVQGGDYCSVLVKTREGRPIKIEGNSLSKVTMGGTSARAQASVLSLYDTSRVDGPYKIANGRIDKARKKADRPSWEEIDAEIMGKLTPNSQIRIVANTILSPTSKQAIADFQEKFANTSLLMYDPVSSSAMIQANEESFGQAAVPAYHFDKADVIVSFDADFLGTWISPIEYAAQYAKNRQISDVKKATMSRHIQVESHMSLTGSNADNRILVKPSEQGAAILALHNAIASSTEGTAVGSAKLDGDKGAKIQKVAQELVAARGRSLVVSGSNNVGEQLLINSINSMLGNYGATVDFTNASMQRQGLDSNIQGLIAEMNAGRVDAVFFMDGANPAYDIPNADKFAEALAKVGLKVAMAVSPNETTALCDYFTPSHHYLESWGDAEPKRGHYSLIQPTISPLFNTRQAEESFLVWAASEKLDAKANQPFLDYLKANWEANMFPQQTQFAIFQTFWDSTLHDGVFEVEQETIAVNFAGDCTKAASMIRQPANSELEISFFETVNMGAGQYANNPWLMELPDPVNRCSWGNYLGIPISWDGGQEYAAFMDLNQKEIYGKADIVGLDVNGGSAEATVVRQFGQMPGTLSLALGYGRKLTGQMGKAIGQNVGTNVHQWLTLDANGNTQYYSTNVNVTGKTGEDTEFACVQYHHTMGVKATDPKSGNEINVDEKTAPALTDPFNEEGFQGGITDRSIIYQANLKELDELVHHIEEKRHEAEHLNVQTLYPYDEYTEEIYQQGHHWMMYIDLNACTGCGACQVACIAENNVPIVGKTEVSRHHEMTWLRVDRYFYGDLENPNVVYQPMMCQHCDNAPCENVCPVAATNHSSEGLNQMTYNRCIGTRYCANNCPYKVRRFNWLDYTTADIFAYNEIELNGEEVPFGADNLTRMVLNPDVTVRSRGVIEKCSFCVQRIQEGKLTAKKEGRALRETDVKSACQTACPTGAIVFGDGNDKKSKVVKHTKNNPLNYLVLEEINVRPSVNYSAKINNRDEALDA